MLLVLTIPTHTHTNKVKKSKPSDEANKSNARMTLFKFTADIPGHIITCLTLSVGTLFSSLYFKCVLYELFSFPQLALENRAIFCFIFPRILCCCPKISSLTYKCPWSTARDVQHSFCHFQFSMEDIFGDCAILHSAYMIKPAQSTLPEQCCTLSKS